MKIKALQDPITNIALTTNAIQPPVADTEEGSSMRHRYLLVLLLSAAASGMSTPPLTQVSYCYKDDRMENAIQNKGIGELRE